MDLRTIILEKHEIIRRLFCDGYNEGRRGQREYLTFKRLTFTCITQIKLHLPGMHANCTQLESPAS